MTTAIPPSRNQYIVWARADDLHVSGKKTKYPANLHNGHYPVSAFKPEYWTDYETAARRAHELNEEKGKDPAEQQKKDEDKLKYGAGFAITESDQYGFIDLDHCRIVDANGVAAWSALALAITAMFPGAYIEVSPSGEGLHILFTYRGVAPKHKKKPCPGLEFYTRRRFTTMTGDRAMGDSSVDHTESMHRFIEAYAKFDGTDAEDLELSDEPLPEWSGPESDEALIEQAKLDRRPRALFGAKVSFLDLWTRNVEKLAKAWPSDQPGKEFDYSRADMSLCNLLAFRTGCHGVRMARLWRASGLAREKQDREDYIERTIAQACVSCTEVYSDKERKGKAKVNAHNHGAEANTLRPFPTAKVFLADTFTSAGLSELQYWNGDFYRYSNGIYASVSKDSLRSLIYPYLETAGENPKPENVSAVLDCMAAIVHLDEKVKVPVLLDALDRDLSGVIVASNGAFNLDTGERIPLSPNLFALNAIPFPFDPDAPDPVEWLKFLHTLWPDDQQSIDALQEIGGLLLTPVTRFQKLFFLIGPRRSGKGTILRVWYAMLGGNVNVVTPTLASLTKDFGLQPFIGKLAALIGDVRLSPRVDQSTLVERLLSISGEDGISVPRKHKPDWDGGLFTRIVGASNELPHFSDASGAAASRVVMLVMKLSFYGKEDTGLFDRLKGELPQILAWHVRGRRRLLERGRFIQPESAKETIKQLEDLGQPVNVFVRDRCVLDPEATVPTVELFNAWRTWCASHGHHARDSANFGKELFAALPGRVKWTRPRGPDGKQYPAYAGIGLASDAPAKYVPPPAPVTHAGIDPAQLGLGKSPRPVTVAAPIGGTGSRGRH